MDMRVGSWTDILSLLSLMILADGRVYKEEVDTFKSAVVTLRDKLSVQTMLTEHMALEWFVVHKDEFLRLIGQGFLDAKVAELVGKLDYVDGKEHIADVLIQIALSDGHEHSAETKLLLQALKGWNVGRDIRS